MDDIIKKNHEDMAKFCEAMSALEDAVKSLYDVYDQCDDDSVINSIDIQVLIPMSVDEWHCSLMVRNEELMRVRDHYKSIIDSGVNVEDFVRNPMCVFNNGVDDGSIDAFISGGE